MARIVLTKLNTDRYGNARSSGAPSSPVAIDTDNISRFYARHNGRPGTRITMKSGGGFAVAETPDQVATKIGGFSAEDIAALVPPPAPVITDAPARREPLDPADEENDDTDDE